MTDIGKMCDECILLFDYRLSYVTGRMKQELYYFITSYNVWILVRLFYLFFTYSTIKSIESNESNRPNAQDNQSRLNRLETNTVVQALMVLIFFQRFHRTSIEYEFTNLPPFSKLKLIFR